MIGPSARRLDRDHRSVPQCRGGASGIDKDLVLLGTLGEDLEHPLTLGRVEISVEKRCQGFRLDSFTAHGAPPLGRAGPPHFPLATFSPLLLASTSWPPACGRFREPRAARRASPEPPPVAGTAVSARVPAHARCRRSKSHPRSAFLRLPDPLREARREPSAQRVPSYRPRAGIRRRPAPEQSRSPRRARLPAFSSAPVSGRPRS